jgi:DNA-binding NarL/FixJ family response regulator
LVSGLLRGGDVVEERRGLSARATAVLRLISQGRTYEQILSLHPEMTYLDIFSAAQEALEATAPTGGTRVEGGYEVREPRPHPSEPWSAAEDAELAQLLAGGENVEEVAARLRRRPDAVRARMIRLNLIED